MVDGNVDQLDKVADEAHDNKAEPDGPARLHKLCVWQPAQVASVSHNAIRSLATLRNKQHSTHLCGLALCIDS